MQQELYLSDVMPGITLMDQLVCFNDEFLDERCQYIEQYVIVTMDKRPVYMVTDDIPTSRHGPSHYQKSANEILKSWEKNPRGGVQVRDDMSGDVYVVGGTMNTNNAFVSGANGPSRANMMQGVAFSTDDGVPPGRQSTKEGFSGHRDGNGRPRAYNPTYGQGNHSMKTGIVFCDQSELGTSNHVDMLLGAEYIQALNRDPQPHTNDAFGNATPASDARLLERRIFRSNEDGVENGIPRYESRLYKRMYYMERDVTEALRPGERDCMIHGYDMSDLRKRIDYKNAAKAQFEPGCQDRNKLMLGNNTMPTPAVYRESNGRCGPAAQGRNNAANMAQMQYM
jgi:hypothetical protein